MTYGTIALITQLIMIELKFCIWYIDDRVGHILSFDCLVVRKELIGIVFIFFKKIVCILHVTEQ